MVDENLRRAQRARRSRRGSGPARHDATAQLRVPYRAPTVPRGVEVPPEVSGLGAHYDTDWARRRSRRRCATSSSRVPSAAARVITSPEILGTDRLADLASMEEPPPVIFAPTHHSHLDTGLMIRAVPSVWRHKLVVAAAADYFFDKKWKATLSALSST